MYCSSLIWSRISISRALDFYARSRRALRLRKSVATSRAANQAEMIILSIRRAKARGIFPNLSKAVIVIFPKHVFYKSIKKSLP